VEHKIHIGKGFPVRHGESAEADKIRAWFSGDRIPHDGFLFSAGGCWTGKGISKLE
jgi:hypothetical protein